MKSKKILQMAKVIFGLFILLSIMQSCKPIYYKVEPEVGLSYFPLQKGHAVTYRVDSTIYDDFGQGNVYTNSYYMKDVVDSSFFNLENKLTHVVLRYMRPIASPDFKLIKSYMVVGNNQRVEVVEDNLRYIKLVFPYSTSITWLGNNFISSTSSSPYDFLSDWDCRYINFGGTHQYENFNCDSTVTVRQYALVSSDTVSATAYGEVIIANETYAKSVGMVNKLLYVWEKQVQGGVARRKGFKAVLNAVAVEN
jgi:hypothetical protein